MFCVSKPATHGIVIILKHSLSAIQNTTKIKKDHSKLKKNIHTKNDKNASKTKKYMLYKYKWVLR